MSLADVAEILGEDFYEEAATAARCGAFITKKAIYNIATALGLRIRGGFRDAMLRSLLEEAERSGRLVEALTMLYEYYRSYAALLSPYSSIPHVELSLKKLEDFLARLRQAISRLSHAEGEDS